MFRLATKQDKIQERKRGRKRGKKREEYSWYTLTSSPPEH
jgi:hypothetical protein